MALDPAVASAVWGEGVGSGAACHLRGPPRRGRSARAPRGRSARLPRSTGSGSLQGGSAKGAMAPLARPLACAWRLGARRGDAVRRGSRRVARAQEMAPARARARRSVRRSVRPPKGRGPPAGSRQRSARAQGCPRPGRRLELLLGPACGGLSRPRPGEPRCGQAGHSRGQRRLRACARLALGAGPQTASLMARVKPQRLLLGAGG
jgi:hypothetical protein